MHTFFLLLIPIQQPPLLAYSWTKFLNYMVCLFPLLVTGIPFLQANFGRNCSYGKEHNLNIALPITPTAYGQSEVVNRCLKAYLRCLLKLDQRTGPDGCLWHNGGTIRALIHPQELLHLKRYMEFLLPAYSHMCKGQPKSKQPRIN